MKAENTTAERYFESMLRALDGLDTLLSENDSPLYQHDLIGAIVEEYLSALRGSFEAWRNHAAYGKSFRISQAESGFPVYQNVLELDNDRRDAAKRLAAMPDGDHIRQEMVDFILSKKQFPEALQKTMAERIYLESVQDGKHFSSFVLPRTVRVSVNPKTRRPYYVTHWGYFDGSANLPMVYILSVEDSTTDMVDALVTGDGKLNRKTEIPLPVDGLLNPALAHQFDDFCSKNSAYGLTLSTIASNMDHDFDRLHPKQLRRFILGPFYHADITVHGETVDKILAKVSNPENQWLMTWTQQEIYSISEKPAKWGLWGGEPARDEYYINTDDLECARMGVSAYERHALVPHQAYQAIYAAGESETVFDGYQKHIFTGDRVLRSI
jgi:hypothetical protein